MTSAIPVTQSDGGKAGNLFKHQKKKKKEDKLEKGYLKLKNLANCLLLSSTSPSFPFPDPSFLPC